METTNSNEVNMAEGLITQEMLDEMRTKIGLKMRIDDSIFNDVATRLAIVKFADGVGDPNPLWHDENYARNTSYGTIAAPPSWLWSVFAGVQFGWRGLAGFHSGSTMEFFRPIVHGDKIGVECIFKGFEGPKPSTFAEKMVIDYYVNNYVNQNNQQVGKIDWFVIRTERKKAREMGTYKTIQFPHPWTAEELEQITKDILAEEIRGYETRYWEDVNIGDELKPVIKGPLGITDIVAFICGGGPPIPRLAAHGVQLRAYQRHPAWAFLDKNTYALEPIFAVHYNQAAAVAMGLPYSYDVGTQRHCWQIHLLTNWMGDDGWLKKCYAEYRKFVFLSDVIRVKGKVLKKYYNENDEACVDVETSAFNQRGENIMPGWATIVLPSREKGTWPVKKLLAQR